MATGGWTRKRLRLDLTTGRQEVEPLSQEVLARWIGGRGLNVHTIYSEFPSRVDAFDPENPLCFAVGPLGGTFSPCSGWFNAAARSSSMMHPSTYGGTNLGGQWGTELKFAGYDQIIIIGRSDKPVYILITDDRIEIRDARSLWGKNTLETTITIQEELCDRQTQVLCIGSAGERLVRYATLTNSFSWVGERLGLGAVMGSKNLKAIAVRGGQAASIADPGRFMKACLEARKKIASDPVVARLANQGTLFFLDAPNRFTLESFTSNSRGYGHNPAERFTLREYEKKYFQTREACFSCPIACGRYTHIGEGPFRGAKFGGLHAEGVWALGPKIGILRWDCILKMAHMCALYGLDPVSTGAALAWAMDSFEHSLLTKNESGVNPPGWGDADRAMKVIEMINDGHELGSLLKEGGVRAAMKLGKESEKLVAHIKGLEGISIDPRIAVASGLSYAVSTGDWDYLKAMSGLEYHKIAGNYQRFLEEKNGVSDTSISDCEGKPALVKWSEDNKVMADLLSLCPFPQARFFSLGRRDVLDQFTACTGIHLDEGDFENIAGNVITLERMLTVKDGCSRQEDTPIDRYFQEGVKTGPYRGSRLDKVAWESALSEYYDLRKWDRETGIPRPEALEGIGHNLTPNETAQANKNRLEAGNKP